MKRLFSKRQRTILRILAGNQCSICGAPLPKRFHADHVRPHSKGGETILQNGQALCPKCNTSKGAKYDNPA
ncbi:HNH endonuclease [Microvirga lotononidis]|uniref:HNH endonuclease n=1 Tax=Microvirga lotononidis TaxID=864069 RepID=UPI0009FE87D1